MIFVIFSLYLLGDIFYRWDGFRYYATLSDFLPSVALITILWGLLAVLLSLIIWSILCLVGQILCLKNRRIWSERILLFICFIVAFGIIFWTTKRFVFEIAGSNNFLKLSLVLCLFVLSVFFTWLLRNKHDIVQENITPLVWLFIFLAICSMPLVFNTWEIQSDDEAPLKTDSYLPVTIKRPNIILLTFDSLTAENMSVYGYKRLTTPFISRWVKDATIFTRAEAASNWTPPSVASLMLGKRGWTHQLYHEEGSPAEKSRIENLPLLMQNNGYTTMAFIHNQMHASPKILGVSKNFNFAPLETELKISSGILDKTDGLLHRLFFTKIKMYDWILKGDFILNTALSLFFPYGETVTPFQPDKAFKSFLNVLDQEIQGPFFAWIHLYPPHYPYLPPEPYMGIFDAAPGYRTSNSQSDLIMVSTPVISKRRPNEDVHAIVDTLRSRYDEFILYSDKQFEEFIASLQQRNRLQDTIIILSADHGESFEHNYVGHGGNFYEEQTHIPLIIKEINQSEGKVIDELIEQTDVPATILALADIPVPAWMEGRSLAPLLRGGKIQSRPVFSMNFQNNPSRGHKITKGGIAIWDGDYKLIKCLDCKTKPELFNLRQDPNELYNIIDKEPEKGQYLLSLILENLNKANRKILEGNF